VRCAHVVNFLVFPSKIKHAPFPLFRRLRAAHKGNVDDGRALGHLRRIKHDAVFVRDVTGLAGARVRAVIPDKGHPGLARVRALAVGPNARIAAWNDMVSAYAATHGKKTH
jgi:hypothetical protein